MALGALLRRESVRNRTLDITDTLSNGQVVVDAVSAVKVGYPHLSTAALRHRSSYNAVYVINPMAIKGSQYPLYNHGYG